MNWKEQTMLCLDVETTGLKPGIDKIVEVGAVLYKQGEILRVESLLINPGMLIPAEAIDVHGITDESVKLAPKIEEITESLLEMVVGAQVLVGYNWPFDASFFEAELEGAWADCIEGTPVIDPLVIVRFDRVGKYWSGKGRHQLGNVAKRFEIEPEGDLHRASTDCIMTLRILEMVKQYLPNDGAKAADVIVRRRKEQDDNFKRWRASQPKRD